MLHQKNQNVKKQAKKIANLLSQGVISYEIAEQMVEELEFNARAADVLAWGAYYFPHIFSIPYCDELHGYFVDIMREPFTSTLAPRGHGKTMIKCFLIPLYLALNCPSEFNHYLNIQSTSTKAKAINIAIRTELEANEKLLADYGDVMDSQKWTERQFVLKNGVVFTAIGSGESVRGINYRGQRPDYLIGDDLYDDDCIENPEAVRKINRWWKSSISYCVAIGKTSCIHLQGTAISREDLLHEKQKSERWKYAKFQAVKSWDEGLVLWPEHRSIEDLVADKADDGSIIFNREKQNEVRDDATSIIKLADIQFYDGRQFPTKTEAEKILKMDALSELPEYVIWNRGAVDPAEKTKEINDFTARCATIKTSLGNYYVYDIANDKLSFNANKLAIENWGKRLRLNELMIETNKGQALFDELKRTTDLPIRGKHETKDKITRKLAQSAKFENHKVFISMLIPDALRLETIEQLTLNAPPHDDISDAVINTLESDGKREIFIG